MLKIGLALQDDALMEKMLDAGFCLPAIGFAFRRCGRGYWIFKGNYLFLSSIKHPVSSICPLDSGLSELG
jgi:hypothetical protein